MYKNLEKDWAIYASGQILWEAVNPIERFFSGGTPLVTPIWPDLGTTTIWWKFMRINGISLGKKL